MDEVGVGLRVLDVATVDGVAGEDDVVAEIFFVAQAEGAGAVGASDPGDSYAGADGEFGCGAVDDLAYDLMSEDERVAERRQVALEDVQVGAADSAGEDAEEDVAGSEGWSRDVFDGERGGVGAEEGGFHWGSFWRHFNKGEFYVR